MTTPTPDDAGLRQRIAEALAEHRASFTTHVPTEHACCADALLPLVAAERATAVHRAAEEQRADAALRETEGETGLAAYGRELADLIDPDMRAARAGAEDGQP